MSAIWISIFFYKSASDCSWNQNLSFHTKVHRNRMIPGWDIAIKPFWKWQPYAILNFKIWYFGHDLCLIVILLLHTKFCVNRTINRGDIGKKVFQYGGRLPFWICNILILCHMAVLRTEICSGTLNFIEIGWSAAEIATKLFSKWRPSAMLNFRKLLIWSLDLCLNMIVLQRTKFHVNRTINRGDIAKRRFAIWRPYAILDLLWRHHIASENTISSS